MVNGEKWRAPSDLFPGARGNSVDPSGKPVLTLLPLLQNQFFSDPRLCNVTARALVNVCPTSQSCFWGTKLPHEKKLEKILPAIDGPCLRLLFFLPRSSPFLIRKVKREREWERQGKLRGTQNIDYDLNSNIALFLVDLEVFVWKLFIMKDSVHAHISSRSNKNYFL